MNAVFVALLAGLAGGLYIVGLTLDLFLLKLLAKPWPVLALAFAVARMTGSRAARRVALGLVAGAVGDVCLALPGGFLPGMGAFAVGHALYITAFLDWNRSAAGTLLLPVAAFCGVGLVLMLPGAGAMALPLAIYVAVIGTMLWRAAACALLPRDDTLARWGFMTGAVLFAVSDFLIGMNRFLQPLAGSVVPIILSYWAGQTLIAATAIRCDRLLPPASPKA